MISLTTCLYVTAGLVIGLLIAFAVQNRNAGWKRVRPTLADALEDLYADFGLTPQPMEAMQPQRYLVTARRAEVPVDPNDFSDQLIRLKLALGRTAAVGAHEATGVNAGQS